MPESGPRRTVRRNRRRERAGPCPDVAAGRRRSGRSANFSLTPAPSRRSRTASAPSGFLRPRGRDGLSDHENAEEELDRDVQKARTFILVVVDVRLVITGFLEPFFHEVVMHAVVVLLV